RPEALVEGVVDALDQLDRPRVVQHGVGPARLERALEERPQQCLGHALERDGDALGSHARSMPQGQGPPAYPLRMQRLGYLTDRLVPPDNVVTTIEGARVVRSAELPSFWFGNLIELDEPPAPGALAAWRARWPELVTGPRAERFVLQWESP